MSDGSSTYDGESSESDSDEVQTGMKSTTVSSSESITNLESGQITSDLPIPVLHQTSILETTDGDIQLVGESTTNTTNEPIAIPSQAQSFTAPPDSVVRHTVVNNTTGPAFRTKSRASNMADTPMEIINVIDETSVSPAIEDNSDIMLIADTNLEEPVAFIDFQKTNINLIQLNFSHDTIFRDCEKVHNGGTQVRLTKQSYNSCMYI